MAHGLGSVAPVFIIAEICQKFGWTWDEYWSQPQEFLDAVIEKLSVENEVAKIKEKELKDYGKG